MDIRTQSGLWLGRRIVYDVDLQRLLGVVARCVRGLFFHHTHRMLSLDAEVRILSDDTLRSQPRDFVDQFIETIVLPLTHSSFRTIGSRVFSYTVQTFAEDPNTSAWALIFFERYSFVALTASPEAGISQLP
jgi:hypothetical protein